MNALASHDFAIVAEQQWLVLLCGSSKTMALAAALASRGAWTPTWKRKRRLPRSPISRVITEPCIPGMVFLPATEQFDLPQTPRCPHSFMRNSDWTLIRIADRELQPLRKIADKPLTKASELPKPGSKVRFNEGPFQGLDGRVITCTQRYASVTVEGFSQPIQVPPCMVSRV